MSLSPSAPSSDGDLSARAAIHRYEVTYLVLVEKYFTQRDAQIQSSGDHNRSGGKTDRGTYCDP
jgi:hypothetical protein